MATLEKIRSKGVFLLIVVGLAMFAFIIGDFLNSSKTFFGEQKQKVGVIDGETVKYTDFMSAVDQLSTVYKIETGQQNNDEMSEQIRQQVWDNKVTEILLGEQTEKVGIAVSKDELKDLTIGNHISPIVYSRRTFTDPKTGTFSKEALLGFLTSLDQASKSKDKQHADEVKEYQQYWSFLENMVRQNTLQQKYNALLSKTITANSLDAKFAFERSQTSVNMVYTMQPYFTVPDGAVKVSESEISDLYNKRKARYKQEANFDLKYAQFEVKPSKADYAEVEKKINSLQNGFNTATDIKGFVNSNSEEKYIDIALTKKEVPPFLQDFAFGGKTGDVVGPKIEGDTYYMAKIVEGGISEPDSVKIRHIVLTDSESKLADSLVAAIKGGAKFADLAQKFSKLQQTAANGGEIGWVRQMNLLQNGFKQDLVTKLFRGGVNEVILDKQTSSIQIIQVEEKTQSISKVKLALLALKAVPSDQTREAVYNQAKEFAAAATSSEKFDQAAKSKGITVRPMNGLDPNTPRLGNVKNTRTVFRWANDAKAGATSDVFECGERNDVLIVANLIASHPKGYRDLKDVSAELKAELINDKKAEVITKNMNSAMASAKTVQALAAALKQKTDTASNLNFFSAQAGSLGLEPAVIGAASASKPNQLSAPVKGKAGVFVFSVVSEQKRNDKFNAKAQIDMLNSRYAYMLPYMTLQVLKDKADITDNRIKFF
jgi:peptidyl-prolyl cis-trans isomerase D